MIVAEASSTTSSASPAASTACATLREAGLRAIHNGMTTIEEIVRETMLDDEGRVSDRDKRS